MGHGQKKYLKSTEMMSFSNETSNKAGFRVQEFQNAS